MTTLLFVPPLHARIEKPKTGYLYLVSVEAGVWLLLYATAGPSASQVSRTIDGSWFQVGLRQNTYPVYVERGVDVCRQSFVPPFLLELRNQRQDTYTPSPSRQAFGYCCMRPPVSRLRMFRVQSMGHGFSWG